MVIVPRDPSVYDAKRCKRFLPMYIGNADFQLFDISLLVPARDSEGLVPFTGKLSKMQFILCKAKSWIIKCNARETLRDLTVRRTDVPVLYNSGPWY